MPEKVLRVCPVNLIDIVESVIADGDANTLSFKTQIMQRMQVIDGLLLVIGRRSRTLQGQFARRDTGWLCLVPRHNGRTDKRKGTDSLDDGAVVGFYGCAVEPT